MPSFQFLSFQDFAKICLQLAVKIKADTQGIPIDYIVSIQRGGALMSKILSDVFDAPIATLTVSTYENMEQKKLPYISQEISTSISKKNVIVVDEICDSGLTLKFVQDYLLQQAPTTLRTAVLFMKSHSVFVPDFWVQTSDKWIVFPGELKETAQALRQMNDLDASVYKQFEDFVAAHGADLKLQKVLALLIK